MADEHQGRDGHADAARASGGGFAGRTPKFWLGAGLSLLGFILLIQNSTSTDVHVLWFTIRMPLVFLLVAMVVLGVLLDRIWQWRQQRRT